MQSDDLGLASLLRSRIGVEFDSEAHLTAAEAHSIAAAIERLVAERDEAQFLLDEGGQAYRAISDLVVQLDKERALNSELRQFSIDYAVERDRATALAEALKPFIPDEGEAEAAMSDAEIGSVNITLGMVRRARQALGDTL